MFGNVVFSRVVSISKARRFVSLSLAHIRRRATENVVVAGFFVALVRIEPEERRRTTLEERQRCRSCVSVPINKQQKLTLIFVVSRTTVELKKQIATDLTVHNPTSHDRAFKVKTTAPKKYCVKPNTGVVGSAGGGHGDHAGAAMPADLENCRDKFGAKYGRGERRSGRRAVFVHEEGKKIQETKLKVVFEAGGLQRSVRKIKRRTEADRFE